MMYFIIAAWIFGFASGWGFCGLYFLNKKNKNMGKIKVYELDFGDTNLLSETPDVILDWIKSEMEEMKDDSRMDYIITVRRMTREEIEALPEWS